jgi:exosome complex RNA-binding protein Rrp42 (RNase PH superfamily)
VRLGGTRVLAAVAAALEAPFNDRSREGALRFDVELSPMASPAFAAARTGEDAVELARIVERAVKQSGAVDMEALCVLPGRKVRARPRAAGVRHARQGLQGRRSRVPLRARGGWGPGGR